MNFRKFGRHHSSVVNLKFAFFDPLLKPYYFMAVNAGLLPLHKNVSWWYLHQSAPQSSWHFVQRPHSKDYFIWFLAIDQLNTPFAGHCFRRVEEPIHSVLFFEPAGTFRPGGHVCTNYVKTLLRDCGLSTISDLSQAMASHVEWRHMQRCWGRRRRFHCLDVEHFFCICLYSIPDHLMPLDANPNSRGK